PVCICAVNADQQQKGVDSSSQRARAVLAVPSLRALISHSSSRASGGAVGGKETTMRSIGGQAGPGSETSTRPIGIWVAAGLSLAVIGFASVWGVFIVSAAVLLAPMVYVFARLRGHAPDARTTSDFVGAVLGERFGVFAGLVQLVAYLLLAVKFAGGLAIS